MNPGRLLFSPSGRLAQWPFAIAVTVVYLVSFLSQVLLVAQVTVRFGLWPFALLQVLLIWVWFSLHSKRLRDAGRSRGLAVGIASLYALAIVLLLLIMVMITASETSSTAARGGQSLLQLFIVLYFLAMLIGSADFGGLTFWMMGFFALIMAPVLIAMVFSIWTATRPGVPAAP